MNQSYVHTSVLLNEVITYLNPRSGENFVDATLGGGGYTRALLDQVEPNGKVLAIDLDEEAIKEVKSQESGVGNLLLHHGNFRDIDKIIKRHDFPPPDGIVADIGLSSHQLDGSERGISFQKKEILDMRFDRAAEIVDARFLVNNKSTAELIKIFREYGEEPYTRQIVRKIQESRSKNQIKYTTDLYQIIKEALPKPVKHKADDSARRIFQALRIEVNHELENLETFLPKAFDLLTVGGRLAVVSFHSLEDRIVKQYFAALSKGCVCPLEFPECICGHNSQGKILTKKPVIASEAEIKQNPRSKAAKLRVIQKF